MRQRNKFFYMKILSIFFGIYFLISIGLYGQNSVGKLKLENGILKNFSELNLIKNKIIKNDSFISANKNLTNQLFEYFKNYKVSKAFASKLQKQGVRIITSPDSDVLISSWFTLENGIMQAVSSIIQYKYKNELFAKVLFDATNNDTDDPGELYTRIYEVRSSQGKIYLPVYSVMYSTSTISEGIQAFKIYDEILDNEIKIFKIGDSLTNKIVIDYNYFQFKKIGSPIIHMRNKSILYIPYVNSSGIIKQYYSIYKFNGVAFIKK
jgi:hypothetical protein